MRSVHTLVQGCGPGPGKQVLDAGCDLAVAAVWLVWLAMLERARYENTWQRDFGKDVSRAIESLAKHWKLLVLLTPSPRPEELSLHELMQAAVDFGRGFRDGFFTYRLVSGVRQIEAFSPDGS